MKAIVFKKTGELPVLTETPDPTPGKDEVVVKISHASLNHRDIWITQGLYPHLNEGVVLGSCGCGIYNDREFIINPNRNWGEDPRYPNHKTYSILGMPVDGTFAEKIAVPQDRLVEKPSHLSPAEAAALPLAGLTAYRAVFNRGGLEKGEKVFISGVGGGVASFAFQFALAAGAEVYVSSGSEDKIEQAVTRGAKGGINYRNKDWEKNFLKEFGPVDLIIDSAAGEDYGKLLKIAAARGRVVNYGGSLGTAKFSPQVLFWKELALKGSTMGNDEEFRSMVEFVNQHKIQPVIDEVFPFENYKKAFEKMAKGKQTGKIVLSIG